MWRENFQITTQENLLNPGKQQVTLYENTVETKHEPVPESKTSHSQSPQQESRWLSREKADALRTEHCGPQITRPLGPVVWASPLPVSARDNAPELRGSEPQVHGAVLHLPRVDLKPEAESKLC